MQGIMWSSRFFLAYSFLCDQVNCPNKEMFERGGSMTSEKSSKTVNRNKGLVNDLNRPDVT